MGTENFKIIKKVLKLNSDCEAGKCELRNVQDCHFHWRTLSASSYENVRHASRRPRTFSLPNSHFWVLCFG